MASTWQAAGRQGGRDELVRRLMAPLDGEALTRRLPARVRISAWVSAVVLVLVTAAYGALMLAVVGFSLDYLLGHVRLVLAGAGGASLAWYVALGSAVLVVAALLVKPALRVPLPSLEPVDLARVEERLLYDYVERLCRALRTPPPAKIRVVVGCDAAASLGAGRGWWSDARLELVLGLTLAASMTLREFTGILAHELGHFVLRRAWRVHVFIRLVDAWFARAIYERDRFDAWLFRMSVRRLGPLRLPFLAARAVVAIGRRVLWLFMVLAHLASCLAARRQEYDSDRCAAQFGGSEAFADALRRTVVLGLAEQAVLEDLRELWHERRVPDDIPALVRAKARALPDDERKGLLRAAMEQRTGWLDTHPSLGDRVSVVWQLRGEPLAAEGLSAADLFADFAALCRRSTTELCRFELGEEFVKAHVVASEELIRQREAMGASREALGRYHQGEVLLIRPVFPGAEAAAPCESLDAACAELRAAREGMFAKQAEMQEVAGRYAANQEHQSRLNVMLAAVGAGLEVLPQPGMGLHDTAMGALLAARRRLQDSQEPLEARLAPLEDQARKRMTLALRLLRAEGIWTDREDAERRPAVEEADRLLAVCRALAAAQDSFRKLSWETRALTDMLQAMEVHRLSREGRQVVAGLAGGARDALVALRQPLEATAYPFAHGREGVSIADYLADSLPDRANLVEVAGAAMNALERLDMLIWRTLAALAHICEQVEAAIGLPRQEPAQPPAEQEAAPGDYVPELARREPTRVEKPWVQVAAAMAVGLAVLGGARLATRASSHYAVLPRSEGYRPTIVPETWTPPPQADVWNRGFQPYRPGATTPQPAVPRYPWQRNPGHASPSPPGHTPGQPIYQPQPTGGWLDRYRPSRNPYQPGRTNNYPPGYPQPHQPRQPGGYQPPSPGGYQPSPPPGR